MQTGGGVNSLCFRHATLYWGDVGVNMLEVLRHATLYWGDVGVNMLEVLQQLFSFCVETYC